MVPDIIPRHRPARARLGHYLLLDGDVVFWVVQVHQQDIEHQRCLGGNLRTCPPDRRRMDDRELAGVRRPARAGPPTWAFFAVGFEGWDDDIADLAHAHAQQALIHALDQPALPHQRVVGLLPSVATQGSYNRKVKHTTHLGDAVQIQNCSFSHMATTNPLATVGRSGLTWSQTQYRPAGCRWNGSGQSRCASPSADTLSGCWWFAWQPGRLCSTRPAGGCRTPAWNRGEPPRLENRLDLAKHTAHVVVSPLDRKEPLGLVLRPYGWIKTQQL